MFKSMRLKNFKAYKDSGEVPLAPLTIIIGANNSGKSTLFHALLGLVQTVRDPNQGWGLAFITKGLVDLNGFHDIVHKDTGAKTSSFEISVGLDANLARPLTLTDGDQKNGIKFAVPDHADISFGLNEDLNEILANRSTLRFGDKPNISVAKKAGERWSLIAAPPGAPKNAAIEFRSVFPCLSLPMSPSQEYLTAVHIANVCASVWTHAFAHQISHIGPLRLRVPWHASIGARTSSEFGRGGENLILDLGSKEKNGSGRTRLELANEWLAKKEILSKVHLVELGKGVQMLLGDELGGPSEINIAGMGEGVSQILPIIAYTVFGANDDCLLVEQPEIHLHPALQAELGDLFIDVSQAGHRQILVETHSEHILLRVRRRIAEGSLKPEQVAILFVEKERGENKIRRLDLNDRGHFDKWPKGFFNEAYQEAMALAEAASKKGR